MKTNENSIPDINVKIERLMDGEGSTKAFASLTVANSFAVHGIRIVDTEKGLKARMPFRSYQSGNETKYQDYFHAVTSDAHKALEKSILDAYSQALEQGMSDNVAAPAMSQQM